MDFLGDFISTAVTVLGFHIRRYAYHWLMFVVAVVSVWCALYFLLFVAPADFPVGKMVTISSGETVLEAAHELAADHIILHPQVFYALVRLLNDDHGVHAGTYLFDSRISLPSVVSRLISGDTHISTIRLTFPEGETAQQMSVAVGHAMPNVTANQFLAEAQPYEGYLFPDTYNFAPDATAKEMTDTLRENFDTRIASLTPEIQTSKHTLSDIVIMASLLEKEARTEQDKRMVAGILWHRIALHMPLQVDAVFGYIESKPTFSPSLNELSIDSPYNTYTHQGLPPGPIDNPGLESLEAAINPIQSNYLYYLTGTDGNMYYATTFAQHKENRAKYLD